MIVVSNGMILAAIMRNVGQGVDGIQHNYHKKCGDSRILAPQHAASAPLYREEELTQCVPSILLVYAMLTILSRAVLPGNML